MMMTLRLISANNVDLIYTKMAILAVHADIRSPRLRSGSHEVEACAVIEITRPANRSHKAKLGLKVPPDALDDAAVGAIYRDSSGPTPVGSALKRAKGRAVGKAMARPFGQTKSQREARPRFLTCQ
jgi:hypothetical protein